MAQNCKRCHIGVTGSHTACPLCQGPLVGVPCPQDDRFPFIDTILHQHHQLIRILLFISAIIVLLCFAVNYLMVYPGFWSLFVALGVVCMWVSTSMVFRKRHNIPKTILWQAVIFTVFTVMIDLASGWRHWSLDYAMPCFFIVAILSMWAVAGILRLRLEDYLGYMLIDVVIGVIPTLFLLFHLVNVTLPSVLCILASVISFAALMIFKDKALRSEITKRLHI